MHVVLSLGPSWLDPQILLDSLGPWALWGAAAIVFAECGLLVGFFLPGDSLLFTVGLLAGLGKIGHPLWFACLVLFLAAIAGNIVGYEIGRATGPTIFSRQDSRLFRREYVDKTIEFFDNHGSRAIVLARFVPIVRTFITVTAGVGQMDRRRFVTFSAIGAALWAVGVTVSGHYLGTIDVIKNNIEIMLLVMVAVSLVPVGLELLRHRLSSKGSPPAGPPRATGSPDLRALRPDEGTGPAANRTPDPLP